MVVDDKDANAPKLRSLAQNWTKRKGKLDESKSFGQFDDVALALIKESRETR